MKTEVLKRIIVENQETIFSKKVLSRKYDVPQTDNITVLVGIRRCGKTFTLYEYAQKLKKEQVLFLDFEDERLIALNSLSNYDLIIDSFKSIYPDTEPILFFDEIQNLTNWHFYLKRLHVKGYKIYVTGSNANLISKDIATYLKGRSLETRIFPFSFDEYLKLKKVKLTEADLFTKRPQILHHFDDFLQYGGFPEVINAASDYKRVIANNIYNLLFYKDLVYRYDKNDYLLKLVVNKITENITKEFSITSLANKIISVYKTSVPTVTDYFTILPEPFLTTNIYPYRTSFVQRQSKRKTYLEDNSFIFLNRITDDFSRLFENLVFNFLQRKYGSIFYYKTTNSKEVDFYIDTDKVKMLVQVSYNMSDSETKKREVSALSKAMDELGFTLGYIFTYNEIDEIDLGNKKVIVTPLWYEYLKF